MLILTACNGYMQYIYFRSCKLAILTHRDLTTYTIIVNSLHLKFLNVCSVISMYLCSCELTIPKHSELVIHAVVNSQQYYILNLAMPICKAYSCELIMHNFCTWIATSSHRKTHKF